LKTIEDGRDYYMKILILTSSPNQDGLTAACGEEAKMGVISAGDEATIICLNDMYIGLCQACNNGWGTCRTQHMCQVEDGFQKLHTAVESADGLVLVTPVYWGEMSESAKAFTDRLRRCEALHSPKNIFEGKPVMCVAAAGGSGNGCITCLESMERFVNHVRGVKHDFIGVTQKNRDYKLNTIREAARKMAAELNLR
jgi:multimeric flavodoxin WrbA